MDKKEIFDTVSSIVADHFVEFVLEVEDTFGAEIEDSEAEKLSTIGEVVDYIAAHQKD